MSTAMNVTGRDNIWASFQGQVEILFTVGCMLPEDMYQRAIENIEDHLKVWKAKVTGIQRTPPESDLICDNQPSCSKNAGSTIVNPKNESSAPCVKFKSPGSDDVEYRPDILPKDVELSQKTSGSDEQVEDAEVFDDNPDLIRDHSMEQSENNCTDACQHDCVASGDNATASVSPESHAEKAKSTEAIRKNSVKGSTRRAGRCNQPQRTRSKRLAQLSQNTTYHRTEKAKCVKKKQKSEQSDHKVADKTQFRKKRIRATKDSRQCDLCFNVYGSESGYRMHMKKHRVSDFPCPHCTYSTTSVRYLDTHITDQHPQHATDVAPTKQVLRKQREAEGGDKYSCDKCDRQFSYVEGLHAHMKIHKSGPLKCPDCPKEFLSTVGYRAHVKLHTGQVLQCPHCAFVSGNLSGLNAHLKRVHEKPKAHLCDICGRGFVTKSRLQQHFEAAHLDESQKTTYECPHCDHKSHNKSNMTTHITNQHTDVPRFVCNICGVTLKYKASLQDHQMRHTTSKTIPCTDCPFLAICPSDLKRHMKRKHCDPKHKCDICDKRFKNPFHLVRHQVIHTSQREFSCDRCAYRCNVKGNLNKHMLHVHKIKMQRKRSAIEKIDATQCQETQPQAARQTYAMDKALENTVINGRPAENTVVNGTAMGDTVSDEAPLVYNVQPYPHDGVAQQQLQYW